MVKLTVEWSYDGEGRNVRKFEGLEIDTPDYADDKYGWHISDQIQELLKDMFKALGLSRTLAILADVVEWTDEAIEHDGAEQDFIDAAHAVTEFWKEHDDKLLAHLCKPESKEDA